MGFNNILDPEEERNSEMEDLLGENIHIKALKGEEMETTKRGL